jgi:hypothetical protein
LRCSLDFRTPIRSAICTFLLSGVASSEIQTQHAIDTSVAIGRIEPLWHLRFRTKPQGGGLFQVRTGPIFEYNLDSRVTLIAGYYFTREQEERRWTTTNRAFGGGELALWGRSLEVDWRSLLERFVVSSDRDYFRFRNRFRVSPPGETAPYIGAEIFADARGLRSTRYSVGLRRNVAGKVIMDIGYFFENRRLSPAGDRHMISTSFHWRNKTRRIDPDF